MLLKGRSQVTYTFSTICQSYNMYRNSNCNNQASTGPINWLVYISTHWPRGGDLEGTLHRGIPWALWRGVARSTDIRRCIPVMELLMLEVWQWQWQWHGMVWGNFDKALLVYYCLCPGVSVMKLQKWSLWQVSKRGKYYKPPSGKNYKALLNYNL